MIDVRNVTKSPERELVNEVKSHSDLPHPHLLAFHISQIVLPDPLNLILQLPGLLILLPILPLPFKLELGFSMMYLI